MRGLVFCFLLIPEPVRAARMSGVVVLAAGVDGGETSFRDLSVLMSIGSVRRAARECADWSGGVVSWIGRCRDMIWEKRKL